MIVWVIAGLLGLATGLRIGWALVNQQSVVSSGMIVALGSLGVVAALNWSPLTVLVDRALHWPNVSIAISEVALIASAAGSCVMITSVSSGHRPERTRRLAMVQYSIAAVIAVVALVLFFSGPRQREMSPRDYLEHNLATNTSFPWLVPVLYMLLALTLAGWVGLRLSNASRRGRALFLFTAGIALIVAAVVFILLRAVVLSVGSSPLVGVGTAATLLVAAMAIVAAGSLLPSGEDWVGARRELRLIRPLQREMARRQPDVGIGVRPRGPLVFRVAERLSLISDSLYMEAIDVDPGDPDDDEPEAPAHVGVRDQAIAVARWIRAGEGSRDGREAESAAAFPGRGWLRQPEECSDREWILEIARQYRYLEEDPAQAAAAARAAHEEHAAKYPDGALNLDELDGADDEDLDDEDIVDDLDDLDDLEVLAEDAPAEDPTNDNVAGVEHAGNVIYLKDRAKG